MRTQGTRGAGVVLVGGLLLGLTACSGEVLGKETGPIGTEPSGSAQAEPASAPAPTETEDIGPEGPATRPIVQVDKEAGTRQQPWPTGREVVDGDWTITLGQPYDGWEEIHAEDPYTEPPEEGTEFWLVPVTLTYTGSDPAEPWLDLQFGFVSEENRSYNDWCSAIVPDDLMEVDALYTDGTVAANVCLQIPTDTDGLWTVSSDWGDPVFFTTQGR